MTATSIEKRGDIPALQEQIAASTHAAVDGVVTITADGKIVWINPAAERLFGYARQALVGRNVSVLMPSPHAAAHDGYISRYLQTGNARIIGRGRDVEILKQDGSRTHIFLTVSRVELAGTMYFTGILHDLTGIRRSQSALLGRLDQQCRATSQLQSVLGYLKFGVLVVDARRRIRFASDTCRTLLDTDPDRIAGLAWEKTVRTNGAGRDSIRLLLEECGKDNGVHRAVIPINRHDGATAWIEIEAHVDPRSDSERMLFIYDVSELQRLRIKAERTSHGQLVGSSAPMQELYRVIAEVSNGDWTVLIEGETGVGKEVVARCIHETGARKNRPFIAVNCAGLADTLLGSQLFGHKRGAFTGAIGDHAGFFEAAAGGTLFLDEIGDISAQTQTTLLRAVQEKEVVRLGDTRPRKTDVRIIAATNRNLVEMTRTGDFRDDLFYRLRVGRVDVPPLRARLQDIPLLVSAFLNETRAGTGRHITEVTPVAMEALTTYNWPGNVRELKNAIDYAVMRARGTILDVHALPPEVRSTGSEASLPINPQERRDAPRERRSPRRERRQPNAAQPASERELIASALASAEGNRSAAARILGVGRATLYRHMKALNMETRKH